MKKIRIVNVMILGLIVLNLMGPFVKAADFQEKESSLISSEYFDSTLVMDTKSVAPGNHQIVFTDFVEKIPDKIKDGYSIKLTLPSSCSGIKVTANKEESQEMIDINTGIPFGKFETTSNSISFIFEGVNNSILIDQGTLVFNYNVEIEKNTATKCDFVLEEYNGAELEATKTIPVEFTNKDDVRFVPISVALSNQLNDYGNIVLDGRYTTTQSALYSNFYYSEDPRGGIIRDGSENVGTGIWINRNNTTMKDLTNLKLDYEIPLDTNFNTKVVPEVYVSPNSDRVYDYPITDLISSPISLVDRELDLTINEVDLNNIEANYGIILNNPSFYIEFDLDLDKNVDSSSDNYIFGGGKNLEEDKLDGKLEGYGTVKLQDSTTIENEYTQYFNFQEESYASGLAIPAVKPEVGITVTDSDENDLKNNIIDQLINSKMEYNVVFETKNNIKFYDDLGFIEISIDDQIKDQIENIEIYDESGKVVTSEYFDVDIVDNKIKLTFKDNTMEMLYRTFTTKITLDTKNVDKEQINAGVTWFIADNEIIDEDVITTFVKEDIIEVKPVDPIEEIITPIKEVNTSEEPLELAKTGIDFSFLSLFLISSIGIVIPLRKLR